jgi:hypothetical protein
MPPAAVATHQQTGPARLLGAVEFVLNVLPDFIAQDLFPADSDPIGSAHNVTAHAVAYLALGIGLPGPASGTG